MDAHFVHVYVQVFEHVYDVYVVFGVNETTIPTPTNQNKQLSKIVYSLHAFDFFLALNTFRIGESEKRNTNKKYNDMLCQFNLTIDLIYTVTDLSL